MKLTLRKELPIIGIVLIPFIYLAFLWNSLTRKSANSLELQRRN